MSMTYPTIPSDGHWTEEKVKYWYNITDKELIEKGFWYNPLKM